MKLSELTDKCVVKAKNGKIGIVVSFNGKPSHIMFNSFSNPLDKWDDSLNHQNDDYTIVDVRDGSPIENAKDGFKVKTFNELKVLYSL